MTLECNNGILPTHPDSIIDHVDQRLAAILDDDGDARCLCVDGVFHQLLHYGSRTAYNFAGRNFIGKVGGENFYGVGHWCPILDPCFSILVARSSMLDTRSLILDAIFFILNGW